MLQQPFGFIDPTHPEHVCRLLKSIYGLKQAPRVWYQWFVTYICTIGFVCSSSDTSLFVLRSGTDLTCLLVYVDDIILTTSTIVLLDSIICCLPTEFAMTDLGALHHFLRIVVTRLPHSLFLS